MSDGKEINERILSNRELLERAIEIIVDKHLDLADLLYACVRKTDEEELRECSTELASAQNFKLLVPGAFDQRELLKELDRYLIERVWYDIREIKGVRKAVVHYRITSIYSHKFNKIYTIFVKVSYILRGRKAINPTFSVFIEVEDSRVPPRRRKF